MTRMKIVKLTKSHKNTEKFPYTANDLAIYMHHYLQMDKIDPQ